MAALLHWYSRHLIHSPIITNVVSGSTVLVVGDYIAQIIEEKHGLISQKDPVHSAVMFSWAGIAFILLKCTLVFDIDVVVT
jgi:hypothetical protein